MNININPLPEEYTSIPEDEIAKRTYELKQLLGDSILILGHHYQMDQIMQFVDIRGDSLGLSRKALESKAKYIIFCGVHFMAESADILTRTNQKIILPDINAGCSMAEMADIEDVEDAWKTINNLSPNAKVIPITYINSSALLKAFCGRNEGVVCTSSNAKDVIKWTFDRGDKLFFFPDQHLGRNSAYSLGINTNEMITWHPNKPFGGNTEDDIKKAKVILWYGFCSIHMLFKPEHIHSWRKRFKDINILVHPECTFEVVQKSDFSGSTSFIIDKIKSSEVGSRWAIGTEINLVNRLRNEHPDRIINSLSPYQCLCGSMFRIRPPYLLHVLERLSKGEVVNQVKVQEDVEKWAKVSLDRMLSI